MPVLLNVKYPGPERRSGLSWPRVPAPLRRKSSHDCLHIGLINNISDAAMGATEQQFLSLLEAAAGEMSIHVTLYSLPEVERQSTGKRRVGSFYWNIEQLWNQPTEDYPDGLIVTGREPLAASLKEESYWPGLRRVLDWTQEFERSTAWSCLAAHAAVLALDGIERVRSPHKHFGILACQQDDPHFLLADVPATHHVPHSRWNGLSRDQLIKHGYQILTHTADGGVDTFIKQDSGLFVFFQGHPEYESKTLLGEYRRDVLRFLKGEMQSYPRLPQNYFDIDTERRLREIENTARASRDEACLEELSAILTTVNIHNSWRDGAAIIYRNWLEHLLAKKHVGYAGRPRVRSHSRQKVFEAESHQVNGL